MALPGELHLIQGGGLRLQLQFSRPEDLPEQLERVLEMHLERLAGLAAQHATPRGLSKADFDALPYVRFNAARPDAHELSSMCVPELKRLLCSHKLDPATCLERQDLIEAVLSHIALVPAPACGGHTQPSQCSICMTEFTDGEQLRQLPCSELHIFHDHCIKQWLEKSTRCPLCRTQCGEPEPELAPAEAGQVGITLQGPSALNGFFTRMSSRGGLLVIQNPQSQQDHAGAPSQAGELMAESSNGRPPDPLVRFFPSPAVPQVQQPPQPLAEPQLPDSATGNHAAVVMQRTSRGALSRDASVRQAVPLMGTEQPTVVLPTLLPSSSLQLTNFLPTAQIPTRRLRSHQRQLQAQQQTIGEAVGPMRGSQQYTVGSVGPVRLSAGVNSARDTGRPGALRRLLPSSRRLIHGRLASETGVLPHIPATQRASAVAASSQSITNPRRSRRGAGNSTDGDANGCSML